MRPLASIFMLILVASVSLAKRPPADALTVKVLDYSEERYNEPQFLDSRRQNGCVNRDLTLDVGPYIAVLRQSTCTPNFTKGPKVIVGESVQTTNRSKRDYVKVWDGEGREFNLKIVKMTKK